MADSETVLAPAYKLTYFPVKALAEPIRFLLRYGGLNFEDIRFEKENWPELRNNMPFGQLPVLELDGKVAYQSIAICRYLAKQVNLVGNDDWENLEIDALVDTISELRQKVSAYFNEKDGEAKEKRKKIIFDETLPFYLQRLENVAEKNKGYLALERLTWADMYFVGLLDYINAVLEKDVLENYLNLQEVRNNVLSLPAISEWINTRPKSDY